MNRFGTCLLIFFFGALSYGQKSLRQLPSHPFQNEIREIKPALKRGDQQALKKLLNYTNTYDTISDYLGYHWGQNTVSGVAWRTFSEYFLFESEAQEVLFDTNKTAFRNMIQPELDHLHFSDVAQAFYLVPLEKRPVGFRLTEFNASRKDKPGDVLHKYQKELKSDLEYGHIQDAIDRLNTIARLNSPEAEAFIKHCFTADFFEEYPFPSKANVYEAAASALSYYPTLQHVDFILKLADEHQISQKQAIGALEYITNIPFNDVTFEKNRYAKVVTYISHFKTMHELRLNGYEKRDDLKSSDFENKTDYYGKMLILSDDKEDRICYMNALYDLTVSKDALSLKYLAGMYYRHRSRWNEYHFYNEYDPNPAQVIEKLTGIQIQVENEQHTFTSEYDWGIARQNYFLYWNNHYSDYVWNDSLNRFINTKTPVAKPDAVADYYQQLGSEMDSVAANAFLMLAESDPEKVKELMRASPEFIEEAKSKHYAVLPMFPQKRLKALVDLTDYCKDHAIAFRVGKDLKQQLDSLDAENSYAALYRLEEYLIKHISLDQVTAIEYWSASGSEGSNYSIGRMLDKLYTKYMDDICKDDDQLRLFLKKAALFDRFGIIGACNKYAWKLSNRPESFKERLKTLLAKEKDPDILSAINGLLQNSSWKSDCAGNIPALYDEPINELETLSSSSKIPFEKQGDEYANLQYNIYFTDRVANGMLSQSQLTPMVKCLKKHAEQQREDSFEFERSMAFSYWLKNQHLPYRTQFEKALELKEKDAYKKLTEMIILQGKYKDIPVLLDLYESENEGMEKWMIQSHIMQDLAIPARLRSATERDTLKKRYSRLSEKELYKAYLTDFGLGDIFKANDSLDYDKLYNVLEYDVVDAFVGGGGRQSTSAGLAIQVLEMHFNTLLGFHWRKHYLYANTVHSFHTRSCAWMKFLRDKKLVTIPEYSTPSFSN
jgi:hypothetical protein